MEHELSLNQIKKEWHGTIKAYLTGLVICFLLTSASFYLAITKPITGLNLVLSILGLAVVQAMLQLRLFLHLGQEAKPRWETLVFAFMFLILVIVVIGTIWIMNDLNERVMMNMTEEMHHD